jgi:hypothetical protein
LLSTFLVREKVTEAKAAVGDTQQVFLVDWKTPALERTMAVDSAVVTVLQEWAQQDNPATSAASAADAQTFFCLFLRVVGTKVREVITTHLAPG